MTAATPDPLGRNADAFTQVVAAARGLTDGQVAELEAAADAAYEHRGLRRGRPQAVAAERAYQAAVASGRWTHAADLVEQPPGAAFDPRLAVLVRDLLDPADYEAMVGPWRAVFGDEALTGPLGPNAGAFWRLLAACRDMTGAQAGKLAAAYQRPWDEAAAGGPPVEPAVRRAYDAAVRAGRLAAAVAAGMLCHPGAYQPLLAVLVSDLIDSGDYAELTGPWMAAFGRPVGDAAGAGS